MNLSLKNIKIGPGSEETTQFTADLCVDGKKIADCSNDGHGGCNKILTYDKSKQKLLHQAEVFTKTLPSIKCEFSDKPLKMDLDFWVSLEVDNFLKEKESKKFKKKLEKDMLTGIVVGIPGANKYSFYNLKGDLKRYPKEAVQVFINKNVLPKLEIGEEILNTNL